MGTARDPYSNPNPNPSNPNPNPTPNPDPKPGIKLSKRKVKYTKSVYRHASYTQGKVDSKEIDINQRSIAGPSGEAGGTGKGGKRKGGPSA